MSKSLWRPWASTVRLFIFSFKKLHVDILNALLATDSKTLSYQEREELLQKLSSDPENLGWAVRVVR